MEERDNIIRLLNEVNSDITKIQELGKYDERQVVEIALEEKLFDSLLVIFKPITINGVTKIYLDAFSTDLLDRIQNFCETKAQAEEEAKREYELYQTLSEEDKQFFYSDRTYEEILASKTIMSKEFKDKLRKSLFTIDMDLIGKIKIKDSHSRRISGNGHPINSVEDVIFYSEPACIASCIALFNKNIVTTSNDTSGVIEDGPVENGKCVIACNYKYLSDENKAIFDELIKNGISQRYVDRSGVDNVTIEVPCNREETVADVSNRLLAVVSRFKMQDCLYGSQTLEEFFNNALVINGKRNPDLYQKYFGKEDYTWDDVIMFAQEVGFIYDPEEDLLWENKNRYERHKEYNSSISSQSSTPMNL